jgi:hypothetical protein
MLVISFLERHYGSLATTRGAPLLSSSRLLTVMICEATEIGPVALAFVEIKLQSAAPAAVDEKCQTKLDLRCTDRCDREPMKIWNVKKLIMETRPSGKIEAQGLGIAAVSDKLLQQRALDLAEQDGRTRPTDADRGRALRELSSPIANRAPEVPLGDENLTVWNQSPDMTGHIVPNVLADDEAGISAELTKEGVEEADQDRRRAAKDEDPPGPD